MTGPIVVHCIPQERWYLKRIACACGSHAWTVREQRLLDGPVDELCAVCDACGFQLDVAFDISSFFEGDQREHDALASAVQGLDEEAQRQMLRKFDPPMTRALAYIQQLAAEGDTLALEFLDDAIRKARAGARP